MRRGRPEAASELWQWRSVTEDRKRDAARARRSGLIRGAIGGLIGAIFFVLGAHHVAYVAFALSCLVTVLALFFPLTIFKRLESFASASGHVVGIILSWLLLTPVFLFFFIPFGLLFRRGPRDSLDRSFDRQASSYWRKLDDPSKAKRFERPY